MQENIKRFILGEYRTAESGIYPASVNRVGDGVLFMADCGEKDMLVAVDMNDFDGQRETLGEHAVIVAPLTHENAVSLRRLLPFTAPSPVLRNKRSIGLGDRLGIAADGQLRALADYDICPVLAQQSMRELHLTGRTYDQVIDSASFAVFRCGFKRPFGADGDHLKTRREVESAKASLCTMITLDCSEHIHGEAVGMDESELALRVGGRPELEKRYLGKRFSVEGTEIRFSREELLRCVLLYGEAIDFTEEIYEHCIKGTDLNFELSIDETETPTSPAQHFFIANELRSRNVRLDTIAPRFCGEFQKAIDYIGDLGQYAREYAVHAAIARHFGYKISIHSGSEKFSVFPFSGRLSEGCFHLKTAGTSWLDAMQTVAERQPQLYREIHVFALEHFSEAASYYHVSADLGKIPTLDSLCDDELVSLFFHPDARQLLHISYWLILTAKDASGNWLFRDRLYRFWRENREAYAEKLQENIGKHLRLLYSELEVAEKSGDRS